MHVKTLLQEYLNTLICYMSHFGETDIWILLM